MHDPDGQVTNWNLGAQRIKGYLPVEAIGRHFSMFYTPEDREAGEPQRALSIAASEGRFEKRGRSEEQTSELQSLMRISYAVLCLKKKKEEKKANQHT